ncbi:unnamed protein product [Somion occarium]|uniref:Fungal-type protein kinase domain-containing protein n=1 Tax=Somion occarium TaxID=3059160 RepID=A0ABP1CQV3_9APHY
MEQHTQTISLDHWVHSVLGRTPGEIESWATIFTQSKIILQEVVIQTAVETYLRFGGSGQEKLLYGPFCTMANKVLEVARLYIPDLPPFPVQDLLFCRNDPVMIGSGPLGAAHRSPDIAVISELTLREIQQREKYKTTKPQHATTGITWTDPFSFIEIKLFEKERDRLAKVNEAWKKKVPVRTLIEAPNSEASSTSTDTLDQSATMHHHASFPDGTGHKRKHAFASDIAIPSSKKQKVKRGQQDDDPSPLEKHETPPEYYEQLASYGLEMLSCTNGTRHYFFQCLIAGDIAEFWYGDATGIILSTKISWILDFEKFAAILVAIACCDHGRWGLTVPNLIPPAPQNNPSLPPVSLEGYSTTMQHETYGEVTVTLGSPIYVQYSLVGRNTCVYNINTAPEIFYGPLVIKMTMQSVLRIPEHQLLTLAENGDAHHHLPKAHMWTNRASEWRSKDGVHGVVFPSNESDQYYEERTQCFIVFTKYLSLESVLTPKNMDYLFNQLLDALHDLRYKAKMIHRDVSLSNLMCEMRGPARDIFWLILNDIDLGSVVGDNGEPTGRTGRHRTGTLPFMAVDLLQNAEATHYLRHDFESVFYVALWCAAKLPKPVTSKDPFSAWEGHDIEIALANKKTLHDDGGLREALESTYRLSQDFKAYDWWLILMWEVFVDGKKAVQDRTKKRNRQDFNRAIMADIDRDDLPEEVSFDDETLDGIVTHKNLKDALLTARVLLKKKIPDLI